MLLGLIAVPAALANGDAINAAATVQFSGVVDSFPSCAGATSITINWGDGATSNGAYDANGNVTGTHTYGAQGTDNGTVTLVGGPNSCAVSGPAADTFTATVKPAPAFEQCPPVGADFGCQFLITASNSGTTIQQDSNQGPYENADDSLIGLVNNSPDPISAIPLSAPGLFSFELDGLCTNYTGPFPSGCNYPSGCTAGSTCTFPPPPGQPGPDAGALTGNTQNGYEGPTSYFTNVSTDTSNGVVNFSPALQPGQSTYFSLEQPPVTGLTAGGTPGSVGFSSPPSVTAGSASFSGFVNPNGAPTTAYFQYGLDARYFKLGASGPLYTKTTPPQAVGGDFSAHSVFATVTGLVPNALYHARLVATNPSGSTFGADITFKTNMAGLPGPPIFGRTVNVSVVSGLVLFKMNGVFIPLTQLRQIPANAVIDALFGTVKIISSLTPSAHGATAARVKTQSGKFGGGIFKLSQTRSGGNKGLVTLSLLESAFKGAPTYASCKAKKAAAASFPGAHAAALSRKVLQTLHASAHGKFRVRGRFSAATVRGTVWGVADRCDGTLTRDFSHSVVVTDFVHHKTITLHAGQSYLARK